MRILTFDLEKHETCPIEVPLRNLAASASALEAARWRMLIELVEHLQASELDFDVVAQIFRDELLMIRNPPPDRVVHVIVKADWHDYAPLQDGLPDMHYRFQIKHAETIVSEDARTKDLNEAKRIVGAALGG